MGLPARCYDSLSEVYTIPRESFLHKYGSRILGGLACAAVVSFIIHLPIFKQVILWGCKITLVIFGQPAGLDHLPSPKKIEQKIAVAIDKGKQLAREHKPAIPKVAAPIVASAVIPPKIKAEAVAVKKAADKIKAVEQKIEKGEEKLANAGHDMADAARKTGNKIKQAIHDRKEAKDQEKYDKLIVRARDAKVKVDESWSLTRLEAEVNHAEDAAWHKRYNGQCPRCHRPARIHRDLKYGPLICPGCQFIYSVGWARSLGAPPRPQPGGWRFPW
jgi:hypothetical protein